MRDAILPLHIGFGAIGLLVGPMAMRAPKRRGRHTTLGLWYQAITFGLCATAVGLVVYRPRVWPLAVIAVLTEAAALRGWQVRRRARPGWVRLHVSLMCASYISFVTAFLVVNFQGSPWPWIVPTAIGPPLIARAASRAERSRTPAHALIGSHDRDSRPIV